MKTLKTLMVEAAITYLCDRNATPHLVVHWDTLHKLMGQLDIPNAKNETVTVSIDPQAIRNFKEVDNFFTFDFKLSGVHKTAFIPTAAISLVVDKHNRVKGVTFNVIDDLSEYMSENAETEPVESKKSFGLKVVK